ncbi:unnamed protein product [Haemonchus placei]|uniref:Ribosomal protein L16 n=1 Tax=Haemonchus placei TaxID=6290 RepID=A0A0N4X8V8_HAEPC|nr:unnamed protein product [Haemonchus placei]
MEIPARQRFSQGLLKKIYHGKIRNRRTQRLIKAEEVFKTFPNPVRLNERRLIWENLVLMVWIEEFILLSKICSNKEGMCPFFSVC